MGCRRCSGRRCRQQPRGRERVLAAARRPHRHGHRLAWPHRALTWREVISEGALRVAGPVVAAVLLRPGSDGQAAVAATSAAAPARAAAPSSPSGFPAPPRRGAVVSRREMGPDALALGVVPRSGRVLVQASVVGPQSRGASGLDIRFTVGGTVVTGVACGLGCYRAAVAVRGRPAAVEVDVRNGPTPTRWRVALPADWPPPDAAALLARAEKAWRALRSLTFHERLGSSPHQVVTSDWRIQAPDRLEYEIVGGGAGVIVGDRRWDRQAGRAGWVQSPATAANPAGSILDLRHRRVRARCGDPPGDGEPGGSPFSTPGRLPGSPSRSTGRRCGRSICTWLRLPTSCTTSTARSTRPRRSNRRNDHSTRRDAYV